MFPTRVWRKTEEAVLTQAEREKLLRVASEALRLHLETGDHSPALALGASMEMEGAAFVTLKKNESLRGCIGTISHNQRLVEAVANCAVAAGTRDHRFPPVTPDELPKLDISISVLGDFRAVTGPEEIEVGKHGILLSKGLNQGLLLPQVATELDLDARSFLELTCHKANLPPDAWKSGASIQVFTAEVF